MMRIKWRNILFDLMVITFTCILVTVILNEFRADRVPLIPPYMDNSLYREMKLSTFQQGEFKSSRCFIFDARPHELYQKNHLAGAVNFPASQFDFFYQLHLADAPPDVPIFIYGRTISRACDKELSYRLSLMGYKNVTVIL